MSYVVLARKWRPMSFEDLVGQDHVARTLANAIASGRIAHAFLFTGVRGVGKTTSARILAKALNCLGYPDKASGPTATPCLKCAACREIADGSDIDVQEIDGASYNGVDEVRRLQDSLPYRPSRDRYKIFIVDEVHMLSQNAWNAFLKTLEEPPPHVKFIFATTEAHKVPVTILSRVQRFDFKMIPVSAIAERLAYVLDKEHIAAEPTAINTLAREAAGSMRDAMSLLDQVIAFNPTHLLSADVSQVLGVASRQVLYDLVKQLIAGNAEGCLGIVADLANQGFDISHVARDVLSLLRDIVVSNVCKDPSGLIDLPAQEKDDVAGLARDNGTDDLVRLHLGFSRGFDDVVRSGQPRAALEMLLIRLARRPALVPIDDLVARLQTLEQRLTSAGRGAGSPPTPAPKGGSSPPRPSSPPTRPSGTPLSSSEPRSEPSQERAPISRHAQPEPMSTPPSFQAQSEPASASPSRQVQPEPPPSIQARPNPASAPPSRPRPPPNDGAPSPDSASRVEPNALRPNEDALVDTWRTIVNRIRDTRPDLASVLQHLVPLALTDQEWVLGLERSSVFERTTSSKETQTLLQRVGAELFGSTPKITFRNEVPKQAVQTLAAAEADERTARHNSAVERVQQHPRVLDAVEILGARVKEVRLSNE